MKMSESAKVTLVQIALVVAISAIMCSSPRFGNKPPEKTTDTLTVVRVDTIRMVHYVDRWKTKTVHDTIEVETPDHDTISVPIPISYIYEKYENATVHYHGYNAGIDSLTVYPKTEFKYITNTETVTKVKEPFIVFGPSVTAGVDMTGQPRVVVGASATININSFKRKKR